MEKITKSEMYQKIIDFLKSNDENEGKTTEDMVNFCRKEIEALGKKAEKAKERAAAKREETDELLEIIKTMLTEEYQTGADITAAIGNEEVTSGMVSYRLTQLCKQGYADKDEVSVPSTTGGKSRRVKAYRLAEVVDTP